MKRLQSKIGELVMENEICGEAIRPFSSVERTLNGSLLDDDGRKPRSAACCASRAAQRAIANTIAHRSSTMS